MEHLFNRRIFLSTFAIAPMLSSLTTDQTIANATQWPRGTISSLPKNSKSIAWTVDDGVSYDTVSRFVDFCERSDIRLTFFVTSMYPSWIKVQPRLQPLIDSGQVQLANHTRSHPDLTSISSSKIQSQLISCEKFIQDHYGVSAKPYFRPPFGRINKAVGDAAADVGYTTPVMWYGSLGDASKISASKLLLMADKWMTEDRILISHANFPAVTQVFRQLETILKKRKLDTVTLKDVFG